MVVLHDRYHRSLNR